MRKNSEFLMRLFKLQHLYRSSSHQFFEHFLCRAVKELKLE